MLPAVAVLKVQPAKFEQKGEAYVPKPKLTKKEKKALAAQQERLLSWGGCDDKLLAEQVSFVVRRMDTQSISAPCLLVRTTQDVTDG